MVGREWATLARRNRGCSLSHLALAPSPSHRLACKQRLTGFTLLPPRPSGAVMPANTACAVQLCPLFPTPRIRLLLTGSFGRGWQRSWWEDVQLGIALEKVLIHLAARCLHGQNRVSCLSPPPQRAKAQPAAARPGPPSAPARQPTCPGPRPEGRPLRHPHGCSPPPPQRDSRRGRRLRMRGARTRRAGAMRPAGACRAAGSGGRAGPRARPASRCCQRARGEGAGAGAAPGGSGSLGRAAGAGRRGLVLQCLAAARVGGEMPAALCCPNGRRNLASKKYLLVTCVKKGGERCLPVLGGWYRNITLLFQMLSTYLWGNVFLRDFVQNRCSNGYLYSCE